ncbi:hypothetical protein JCM11251_002290 [Rhodosporidiobolus azoricus]
MSPSPSPFNHQAPPARPSVSLPSPSLSPSIASLLSSTSDSAPHSYEPNDYFSPSSATVPLPLPSGATPSDVFPAPAGRASPSPSPASSRPPNSFSNLLAPDPAYSAPPAPSPNEHRPRSSHKRPRPTSSGSSVSASSRDGLGTGSGSGSTSAPGSSAGLNGGTGAGGAGRLGDEAEGAMEPPTSRVRRSSSTSSASASTSAPPSSHGRVPPPPPPPAPGFTSAPPPPPPARRQADLPLEPSVFNVEPIDEFTREVADWLWGFCAGLDWDKVEIEAKIGLLVDQRAGGSRVHLPVPIETILTDDTGLKFQSNMTVNQHRSFNLLLNSRVESTASSSYPYAQVRYAHTREIDSFHELSPAQAGGGPKRKVRLTRDQKGQKPPKAVEKVRVADMNIYSPKRMFDWRVSVSLENPAPLPDTHPTHTRYKDRISYTHQLFTIDLTQVSPSPPTPTPNAPPPHATHELEIEFRNARVLLEEAAKEQRGEEGSRYLEMVQGLLNNVRMLIRNASEP